MQKLWLGSKKLRCVAHILCAHLVLFYSFSVFGLSSSEVLNRIPDRDRKDLEELFNYLVKRTTFSYTLFGDKPVSWFVISLPEFPKLKTSKKIIHRFSGQTPLWSKWQIWKIYEKDFPLKNFLLIEDTNSYNAHRKDIFFINKKYFIETVNQHKKTFQKVLNRQVSGKILLKEVENKSCLQSILAHNDLLLGILLGFGEHNSSLYQQREDLGVSYKQYKSILVKNAPEFEKLEKKAEEITNVLQPIENYEYSPLLIGTVQFVADLECPQTKACQKKYNLWREKICLMYSKGNLLEITLSALVQE
jgi:hypothetical protein